MIKKLIFIPVLLLFFLSCDTKGKKNEEPIAEVGDRKLYLSDIKQYLEGLSKEDSVTILVDYVNRWAKKQVVLLQAENNLSKEDKDLTEEIDNYRTSLLVYKYEQLYIDEKMDTVVREAEVEQFYKDNPDNFQLPGLLVKALYIKVPNDFQSIDKIRQLYRSNKEKDEEELNKIAIQGAETFDMFNDEWVDLNSITNAFPGTTDSYENRVIRMKYIEDSDDRYTYFLKIRDLTLKGSIAPLEHVRTNIKNIILNRRKTNIVRQMENSLYSDAINKNEVKINITK